MQLEEIPKASLARGQNLSPVGFHIHNKDGGSQNFLHSSKDKYVASFLDQK